MNVSDYDNNLRISELPKISALGNDDYLVLQRGTTSYKVKFSTFKAAFFNVLNSDLGLCTAASCDSMDFAKFAHGHEYSDFWFFPTYGPSSQNPIDYYRDPNKQDPDGKHIIKDGDFKVTKYLPGEDCLSTYTIPLYQPSPVDETINELSSYNPYKPGDVQLVATKDFNAYLTGYRSYQLENGNIKLYSDKFDGFVIPNGMALTCQPGDFQDACKLYAANHNPLATSFVLPNLSSIFFKCDPGLPTAQMSPLSVVEGHTALPKHNHSGKCTSASGNISLTLENLSFKVKGSAPTAGKSVDKQQYINCIHPATGQSKFTPKEYNDAYPDKKIPDDCMPHFTTISLDGIITRVQCEDSGDGEPGTQFESWPDYMKLQPLLYIGKK